MSLADTPRCEDPESGILVQDSTRDSAASVSTIPWHESSIGNESMHTLPVLEKPLKHNKLSSLCRAPACDVHFSGTIQGLGANYTKVPHIWEKNAQFPKIKQSNSPVGKEKSRYPSVIANNKREERRSIIESSNNKSVLHTECLSLRSVGRGALSRNSTVEAGTDQGSVSRCSSVEPQHKQISNASTLLRQRSSSVNSHCKNRETFISVLGEKVNGKSEKKKPGCIQLPLDIDTKAPSLTGKLSVPTLADINYILKRWSHQWAEERNESRDITTALEQKKMQSANLENFGLPVLKGKGIALPSTCWRFIVYLSWVRSCARIIPAS